MYRATIAPLLFLFFAGCSSEPAADDGSNDALTLGSRVTSSVDPGTYDLVGGQLMVVVTPFLDRQQVALHPHAPACDPISLDVREGGLAVVKDTDRPCEANLELRPVNGGLSVDGEATLTNERLQSVKIPLHGTLKKRADNALVDDYVSHDQMVSAHVISSTEDRMELEITPGGKPPFRVSAAKASANDLIMSAITPILGEFPSKYYDFEAPNQCDGVIGVGRVATGQYELFVRLEGHACDYPFGDLGVFLVAKTKGSAADLSAPSK